jgi:hypothetical protein
MSDDRQPVDPRSPTYQEFARLYRLARATRPPVRDDGHTWNGELLARDDIWGSTDPRSGAISLNKHTVLPYLTGRPSPDDRAEQTQALQTVLHEYYHHRVVTDARHEPNAVRTRESLALDEGLTEYQAKEDVGQFARRAGYGPLDSEHHAYPAAYIASSELLTYAAPAPSDRAALAQRALDQPIVMRWDAVADQIVRSRLDGVVPRDPQHQQAARAALVRAMAHPGWQHLERAHEGDGRETAKHTRERLDAAIHDIGRHYADLPSKPYPASPVNREAVQRHQEPQNQATRSPSPQHPAAHQGASQQHAPRPAAAQHGRAPDAQPTTTGVPKTASAQQIDPALRAAFAGTTPATGATSNAPALGDGSRGAGRQTPGRDRTPTGRDDRS